MRRLALSYLTQLTDSDVLDSVLQVLPVQLQVFGVDHLVQVLLLHFLFHLHQLHHPVHINHFLRTHFSWCQVPLLFQVLSHCLLSRHSVRTQVLDLNLSSVLLEVLFHHWLVLFDWRVFQLVEITLGLLDTVKQTQFYLWRWVVVAAKGLQAPDSSQHVNAEDFD